MLLLYEIDPQRVVSEVTPVPLDKIIELFQGGDKINVYYGLIPLIFLNVMELKPCRLPRQNLIYQRVPGYLVNFTTFPSSVQSHF